MSNLLNNTTDLQNILAEVSSNKTIINEQADLITQIKSAIDELPEAGSGGIPVVVTGKITPASPFGVTGAAHYTDSNGICCTANSEGDIVVLKNTIIYAYSSSGDGISLQGGTVIDKEPGDYYIFYADDNFTLMI